MRQTLRKIKWRLDPILGKFGYKLQRIGESGPSFLSQLLADRMAKPEDVVFVQIGANDGISTDPLYPLVRQFPGRFRGLVVEPLKDKFELLTRAYAGMESVLPVNVAIHNTEREMLIHRVRPDMERRLPAWARGIGSFSSDHHNLSQLDSEYMTTEKVACRTLDELLTTHNVSDVELLVTDTEGYDYEILWHLDLKKFRPTYIHFEHGLSNGVMTWEKYRRLIHRLAKHGYSISHESSDATAFLPESLAEI